MEKKIYKPNENKRARQLNERAGAAPVDVSTPKPKRLLVDMNCAADVPVVRKKIDMLIVGIVTNGMMSDVLVGERFGLFDVNADVEDEFRRLAGQQGLTVLEVQG